MVVLAQSSGFGECFVLLGLEAWSVAEGKEAARTEQAEEEEEEAPEVAAAVVAVAEAECCRRMLVLHVPVLLLLLLFRVGRPSRLWLFLSGQDTALRMGESSEGLHRLCGRKRAWQSLSRLECGLAVVDGPMFALVAFSKLPVGG